MWSVGMALHGYGFGWREFVWTSYFSLFLLLISWCNTVWDIIFREPLDKSSEANEIKQRNVRRLKLLALLVAMRKVDGLPHVAPVSKRPFQQRLRKAYRGKGKRARLMMNKLGSDDQEQVLTALTSLPDKLIDDGDLRSAIIDTGSSYNATGFDSDFVPGSLTDLPEPIKLDGIAGSLTATKQGTLRHTVLSDAGTEEGLEMTGIYMPGLNTRPLKSFWTRSKRTAVVLVNLLCVANSLSSIYQMVSR